MICHVAVFALEPGAQTEQVDELSSKLVAMAALIDGVDRYDIGPDLGIRKGNDDLAIAAVFRDEESLTRYLAHPEHLAILAEYGPSLVATKHSVQFVMDR